MEEDRFKELCKILKSHKTEAWDLDGKRMFLVSLVHSRVKT